MRIWTMSTADAADQESIDWYARHCFENGANDDRVARAWLLETVPFHEEIGSVLPQVMAIYESVEVQNPEEAYWPDSSEWQHAPGEISGARTVGRQVLMNLWVPTEPGQWWCSVRMDPREDFSRTDWQRFENWYTYEHVGETVIAPGINEAWRLGEELRPSGRSGFHSHFRWAMYELQDPEDMMRHVSKEPLKPIWHEFNNNETFSRTYHTVVKSL